jgi:NAD(P)-dependent dehydrogenase (short-subunit alcohol dehydrogenase family)
MSKLVTIYGGSGFIGRYIARRMAKEGWRVGVVGACVDGAPVTINEGEAEGAALLSNSILTRLFDESITNSVRTPILF